MTMYPTRHPLRHVRRSTALAAAALLLSAPLLSACGFDAATNRVNIISAGVNDRDGSIDVLGAVIVAPSDNTGEFVASLANNLTGDDDGASLDSLAGAGSNADVAASGAVPDLTVPPGGSLSMIGTHQGIAITGTFAVGQFVTVTLGFSNGQNTTMTVPVVAPCLQYADVLSGSPSSSATASGDSLSPSATTSPSVDADGGNDDPYSCSYATRPTQPASPEAGDTSDQ